ncbi:hypothetical protein GpartN1_g7283.t1 [Galdieria partita]|uniref:Uncharacterized protein n=1 Tax=Galdieria partita TaxID=83374 RepID=A0A9C7Q5X5_9RHOD|nr:hypothetical protein GpartN1_g7283.t1 [Galdieria partita]
MLKTRFLCKAAERVFTMVGLKPEPNAKEVLEKLYQETLEKVKILPEKSVYRQNVEKITNYRWKVVKESETVEAIEERVGMGLVEELIEQAKNELDLIPKFQEWKLWEGDPEKIKINILD